MLVDKAILEEVVQDDDQVSEELVYSLFVELLPRCFRRVARVAQQKKPILLVKLPAFAEDALDSLAWGHLSME